jgi:hypothetical protein
VLLLTKNGLGHILGVFSKTHLVTLIGDEEGLLNFFLFPAFECDRRKKSIKFEKL